MERDTRSVVFLRDDRDNAKTFSAAAAAAPCCGATNLWWQQAPSAVPLGLDSSLVQQNLGDVEERERQLRARTERAEQQPAAAAASAPSSQGDDMVVKVREASRDRVSCNQWCCKCWPALVV